jgi:flagellar hook-associated protein 3 FlgL
MQVNTRATHDAATTRMTDLRAQVDALQAAISTGQRIATPDADPVGATRLLTIDRALTTVASEKTGIDRAVSRLTATDAALAGTGTVLQRAKEIALAGANATLNPADRATLAAEVGQLSEQLAGYANTHDSEGASLFGGARTGGAAYAPDASGAMAWQGAGSAGVLVLDDGAIPTGIDGPAAFAGLPGAPDTIGAKTTTDAFAMLGALGAALANPDPIAGTAGLMTAQSGLDAAISRNADTRATVGTRLARLDTETSRLDAATIAMTTDQTATGSLDITAAIVRLQRLSTVLQATQLSFAKVSALSLWEYIH